MSRPKRKRRPRSSQPQTGATIICLEGASTAGKTTLSHAIAARTGAAVIAEVWALFGRPSPEPPLWYLEKQVERWRFALKSAEKHGLAILDGDPFQPLWYGWAYGFIEPHTLNMVTSFYRNAIAAGSLAFPDRYILLAVGEPELMARSERRAVNPLRLLEHLADWLGTTPPEPQGSG